MLTQWGTSLTMQLVAPLLTGLHTLAARPEVAATLAARLATASTTPSSTPLTRDRLDALTLACLALVAALYTYGTVCLWRRGGVAACQVVRSSGASSPSRAALRSSRSRCSPRSIA